MLTVFMIVVLAGAPIMAQPLPQDPCRTPLSLARQENSKRLDGTLGSDRSEYMPNELMVITISLRNTTGETLEVFDPWQPGSLLLKFTVDTSVKEDPEHPRPRLFDPEREGKSHRLGGYSCSGPAIRVQPGEVLIRRVRSDQPMTWQHPLVPIRSAPEFAGDYLLSATYESRTFSKTLHVVAPKVEGYAELKLRTPNIVRFRNGQVREDEQFVHGFVLSQRGRRYLAVEAGASSAHGFPPGTVPGIAYAHRYMRIAELAQDESLGTLEEERNGQIAAHIRSGGRDTKLLRRPELDEVLK